MAQTLYGVKEYGESLKFFKEALDIATEHFTLADQLVIVECIIKCQVKMSELESASKIVSEYLGRLSKSDDEAHPKELYNTFFQR
jgi:ribosomal protein L16/L10AE